MTIEEYHSRQRFTQAQDEKRLHLAAARALERRLQEIGRRLEKVEALIDEERNREASLELQRVIAALARIRL